MGMSEALVQIGGRIEPLLIRVNGTHPTFRLASDRIAQSALRPLDPLLEDLLDVASSVFAADSSVARGGATRADMGAGWKRRFDFTIPVRDPEVWTRADVSEALEDAVSFLTGDVVTFSFRQRSPSAPRQAFLDLDPHETTFCAEDVILFSGGLDSFAGALERLSTSDGKVILLSHRSAQKVIPRQERLAAFLTKNFPSRVLHLGVSAMRVGAQGVETTQRSRSFLFAALGQAVAAAFGAKRLSFYENGVVSHNLPISPQVVGTMASRTTHPETLAKLNVLMRLLYPDPVAILNEYQWLTKTEVVSRIEQFGGTGMIGQAVSCTSVRDQNTLHTHCGRCSQCLDRRFAILAAGLSDHDPPEAYATDVLIGSRDTGHSTTMATEWVRHALRLRLLSDSDFLATFGPELTRIGAGHPDLGRAHGLRLSCDMHRRHAAAVLRALENAVRDHAAALVSQVLPTTCLLRLHCGESSTFFVAEPTQAVLPEPLGIGSVQDLDLVPDPDAPLTAAFFSKDGQHVVAIHGLGRITGRSAEVAHQLKPQFDEDRARALSARAHHFVRSRSIMLSGKAATKDAIRKSVSRCRKQIAEFYHDVFGKAPPGPLLIETHQGDGYRLDPLLRLTTTDEFSNNVS